MNDENQVIDSGRRLRKILIWVGLGLVLLVGLVLIYQYFSVGKISLQTDDAKNYVSITLLKNGAPQANQSFQAQQKLSRRLKPGTYELVAFNNSFSVNRVVRVKARQTIKVTLNPAPTKATQAVYDQPVNDLAADGSRLVFLDETGGFVTIDANDKINNSTPLGPAMADVRWASTSLGVAGDNNNNLYLINGTGVSALKLPFSADKNTSLNYDIASNGEIYITQGKDIYKSDAGGSFTKIFTADSDDKITSIAASPGRVAVVASDGDVGDPDSGAGNIIAVTDAGKKIEYQSDATKLIWSPNGQSLLATGLSRTLILSTSLGQISEILSSTNNGSYAWQDNNNIYYSKGSELWSFNVSNQQSQKVAVTAAQNPITELYRDFSDTSVYFSVNSIGSDGNRAENLYKVITSPQSNQPADDSVSALSVFLPETVGDCQLGYVNFIKPTITVRVLSASQTSVCLAVAKNEIQTYGLNPAEFQYSVSQ